MRTFCRCCALIVMFTSVSAAAPAKNLRADAESAFVALRFDEADRGFALILAKSPRDTLALIRRGQIALQKYEDLYGEEPPNSRRVDIPKDMLPVGSRLVEGRRYFDFSDAKHSDMTPIFQLVKEFMKGREGK